MILESQKSTSALSKYITKVYNDTEFMSSWYMINSNKQRYALMCRDPTWAAAVRSCAIDDPTVFEVDPSWLAEESAVSPGSGAMRPLARALFRSTSSTSSTRTCSRAVSMSFDVLLASCTLAAAARSSANAALRLFTALLRLSDAAASPTVGTAALPLASILPHGYTHIKCICTMQWSKPKYLMQQ